MAKSILAAVHDAIAGAASDVPEGAIAGAQAPNSTRKDEEMSKDDAPAGGDKKTGISQAEHDAAVKAAADTARAEGEKAAAARLTTALSAEGIKGDAARMSAALDLAQKSSAMSGEDVAAFITANVPASKSGDAAPKAYENRRLAAAAPAAPAGGQEKSDKSALAGAVERTNKRR